MEFGERDAIECVFFWHCHGLMKCQNETVSTMVCMCHYISLHVHQTQHFMYAFADEKDPSINTVVRAAAFADLSVDGQLSKLRQVIIAPKKAETEPLHLDQPLDSIVLSKLGDSYYDRCKLFLPAVVDPCDILVSRLAREMEKRHLTLRDVWDTRTKVSTTGDTSVEVVHNQPKEESAEKKLPAYLFKHLTLMVAHAQAASMPPTPPSGPLPREVRGSDNAQYVPVSIDIVSAYYFRVFAAEQKLLVIVTIK